MLEVARALPPELLSVRSTSGELGIDVQRGVQLLDRELAEADMGAYASRGENGLVLVHVAEGGGEQTLGQILDTLEAEIADREQILTAEERRVFSDALAMNSSTTTGLQTQRTSVDVVGAEVDR